MAARGTGRPTKYILRDGTQVKGVTTIIGRFKESGPLLFWAFEQGRSGAASLYEKRDEAGDAGKLVHSWVESNIHGTEPPVIPPEMKDRVSSAFSAWQEWFAGSKMQIVATEVPLVSEQYRYGGTIDAVARDGKGRLCLLDWKSSNAVYSDYALQLAAYRQLWNERALRDGTDAIAEGGYHLCRFAKTHGDFEHRYWPELNDAWDMFALLVKAYELDKKLRERIK